MKYGFHCHACNKSSPLYFASIVHLLTIAFKSGVICYLRDLGTELFQVRYPEVDQDIIQPDVWFQKHQEHGPIFVLDGWGNKISWNDAKAQANAQGASFQ